MLHSNNLPKIGLAEPSKALAQLREIAEEGYQIPKTVTRFS
jgi:hypothetical protein